MLYLSDLNFDRNTNSADHPLNFLFFFVFCVDVIWFSQPTKKLPLSSLNNDCENTSGVMLHFKRPNIEWNTKHSLSLKQWYVYCVIIALNNSYTFCIIETIGTRAMGWIAPEGMVTPIEYTYGLASTLNGTQNTLSPLNNSMFNCVIIILHWIIHIALKGVIHQSSPFDLVYWYTVFFFFLIFKFTSQGWGNIN